VVAVIPFLGNGDSGRMATHPLKIPCQVTQIFQIQLLVIEFIIKMSHIGFMLRGTRYVGGGGQIGGGF